MTIATHISPEEFAIEFAKALASRDFEHASRMTTDPHIAPGALQRAFDEMIPSSFGPIDPIEIGTTMDDWPDRCSDDVLWVYLSLGGRVYAEGLTLTVARKPEGLRITSLEWGRP